MTNMKNVKPIDTTYLVDNEFKFELVERKGRITLFKRINRDRWEVQIVRTRVPTGHTRNSPKYNGYTHIEYLCGNEDFGRYAWHYNDLSLATVKFESLVLCGRYA